MPAREAERWAEREWCQKDALVRVSAEYQTETRCTRRQAQRTGQAEAHARRERVGGREPARLPVLQLVRLVEEDRVPGHLRDRLAEGRLGDGVVRGDRDLVAARDLRRRVESGGWKGGLNRKGGLKRRR